MSNYINSSCKAHFGKKKHLISLIFGLVGVHGPTQLYVNIIIVTVESRRVGYMLR